MFYLNTLFSSALLFPESLFVFSSNESDNHYTRIDGIITRDDILLEVYDIGRIFKKNRVHKKVWQVVMVQSSSRFACLSLHAQLQPRSLYLECVYIYTTRLFVICVYSNNKQMWFVIKLFVCELLFITSLTESIRYQAASLFRCFSVLFLLLHLV